MSVMTLDNMDQIGPDEALSKLQYAVPSDQQRGFLIQTLWQHNG
jgi:hypothetical protein